MSEDAAGIGHNNPPPFDPDVIGGLRAKAAGLMAAHRDWIEKGILEDDEQARRAADHIAGLRALKKEALAAKAAAKKPHQDAAKACDTAFDAVTLGIDRMLEKPLAMQTAFLKAKQERIDAERRAEQERIAREKAALEEKLALAAASGDAIAEAEAEKAAKAIAREEKRAAAPVKAAVGSATGAGATISMRKLRHARIVNARLLALHFVQHPDMLDLLQRLANRHIRAADWDGVDLPGTTHYEEESAA